MVTFALDEVVKPRIAALVTVDQRFDQTLAPRLHDELIKSLRNESSVISPKDNSIENTYLIIPLNIREIVNLKLMPRFSRQTESTHD